MIPPKKPTSKPTKVKPKVGKGGANKTPRGKPLASPDEEMRTLLKAVKTIALVGASNRPERDSYVVLTYLKEKGYKVIPINPLLQGKRINGLPVRASLKKLRTKIDMVDIFRASEHVADVMEEVEDMAIRPQVIWMQLGVEDKKSAERARDLGMTVIMNKCPKIEYERLMPPKSE